MIKTTMLAMMLVLGAASPTLAQHPSATPQRTDSISAHVAAHPKQKAASKVSANTMAKQSSVLPSKSVSKFGGVAKTNTTVARTKSKTGKE